MCFVKDLTISVPEIGHNIFFVLYLPFIALLQALQGTPREDSRQGCEFI